MTELQSIAVYEPSVVDSLRRQLQDRTLVLAAPVGSGGEELAADLIQASGRSVVYHGEGDYATLTAEIARAALRARTGLGADELLLDTNASVHARLALAERLGPHLQETMAAAEGHPGSTLAAAVAPLSPDGTLVITNAHRIPERALWELREITDVRLLLTTRPAHVEEIAGREGPLFGAGTISALDSPPVRRWAKVLSQNAMATDPSDLEWLLERTRGRVRTTLDVLRWREGGHSARTAWKLAVKAAEPLAAQLLAVLESAQPLAPRLIEAIAHGQPPYAATPDAASQRIARALRELRETDVLEQPKRRQWRIADPLLEGAIRRLVRTRAVARVFVTAAD